jgi:hypothetical protein
MLICVDPGATGAIACMDSNGKVWVDAMPETMADIYEYFHSLSFHDAFTMLSRKAFIEKVGGYVPGNAGPGSVKFARHVGHLEMALLACSIPTEQVSPAVWMRGIGVPKLEKADRKRWIKDFCQRRFPSIKVTLINADALGMLAYCMDKK